MPDEILERLANTLPIISPKDLREFAQKAGNADPEIREMVELIIKGKYEQAVALGKKILQKDNLPVLVKRGISLLVGYILFFAVLSAIRDAPEEVVNAATIMNAFLRDSGFESARIKLLLIALEESIGKLNLAAAHYLALLTDIPSIITNVTAEAVRELVSDKRYEVAIDLLYLTIKTVKDEETKGTLYALLGDVQKSAGDITGAIKSYKEALPRIKDKCLRMDVLTALLIGEILSGGYNHRTLEEVEHHVHAAKECHKQYMRALSLLAAIYIGTKNLEKAKEYLSLLKNAIEGERKYPRIEMNYNELMGRLHEIEGNIEKARSFYKNAIEIAKKIKDKKAETRLRNKLGSASQVSDHG